MAHHRSNDPAGGDSAFRKLSRQPRLILLLLAAWSALAATTHIFVNAGLFFDTNHTNLGGALGGFALGMQSIPLAVVYLYCARDPEHHPMVFWLALIHHGVLIAALVYHFVIGTFGLENLIIPLAGSLLLAVLSFLQIFEPRR